MSRRRAFEGDEVTFDHHSKRLCPGLTSFDRYTVAWLCALHIEMAAARAMLDEEHDSPPKTDSNSYVLGTIQRQHVVIACLPASAYGTNNAAIVMSNLKRTFPNIDVCLMVGIGGGVPTKVDLRLGDIVVGTRVMQYDLGKTINGELQRTGVYKHPGSSILTVISNLRSRHELEGSRVPEILKSKMEDHPTYGLPTEQDRLFESSYNHACPEFSCDECDQNRLKPRKARGSTDPVIYYGGIASGNQVVKDATYRNKIAGELDVLCFEMEAAGLMDIESCLPIRGICDYSDSHKAKGWQRYAAATAAAYAHELLEVRGQDTRNIEADHITSTARKRASASKERRDQFLKSLDFAAMNARKTTIKAAHSRTCRWFLKHKDYVAWKDPAKASEHHGFLWIRGKPGSGKSTIMKSIYLETKKEDRDNQILTASFFFNARGENLEKTISGMYRSLLLQLFKGFPDLQCVLDDSDLLPQSQITCPSLNSLKDLLRNAVLRLDQRSFTCFIDALDECDEQQVVDLVYFFEDLAEACTENGVHLRICFSSRHYPYIDIERGIGLVIEDQEGHASDLESYIKSNLRIKDPGLVVELQEKMLVKASGVFLWVVLVVDVLNDENRRGRLNLRRRLEQVPNGLSELFKDILKRDASNGEELQLCLLWILLSKRPLRPDEYYHALWSGLSLEGLADAELPSIDAADAGDCFNKSVISSSKGLAEITKAIQPTVQFIHESVPDFLIKDNGLAEIWPEVKGDWKSFGHDKLKRCCSFYIQRCVPLRDGFNKYPFVQYACPEILGHANRAADTYCQEEFLRKFPTNHWIKLTYWLEEGTVYRYTLDADLLYILADMGYPSLIRSMLKSNPCIDLPCKGGHYVYPLIAAMSRGHRGSILALLDLSSPIHEGVNIVEGISPKTGSTDGKNYTPLSWACEHGYLRIAKLLVQRGALPESKKGWTPFTMALKGHQIETARWLIEMGADLELDHRQTIKNAVRMGDATIVKVFLDQGFHPDTKYDLSPMLCEAARRGLTDMVKVILEKGGDVNIKDYRGMQPIHLAKCREILEILLERGADVNARNPNGETCLWNSIPHLELEGLEFLVKSGADANTRDDRGDSCLHAAVAWNRAEVADLLCRNGADVNARNRQGDTCLHAVLASDRPTLQLLEVLLRYKVEVNAVNHFGFTYLHGLAGHSKWPISYDDQWLQILGMQGTNINVRDYHGNTPLHFASQGSGNRQTRRLGIWLRYGANINLRNHKGQTPLDIAIKEGNAAGSEFLRQSGGLRGSEIDSQ